MKRIFLIFPLLVLLLLAACSATPPTTPVPTEVSLDGVCVIDSPASCETPAGSDQPALYGTWTGEVDGEPLTLTINETCVDLFFDNPGEEKDTETHYEIQSVDWAKDLLTLTLDWQIADCEKRDGEGIGGFMKVRVEGDQLYYSVNDVPPDEAGVGPLIRQ
jgi:hypothetical protein